PGANANEGSTKNNKGWYITRRSTPDGLHWLEYDYGAGGNTKFCLNYIRDDLGRQVSFTSSTSLTTLVDEHGNAVATNYTINGGFIKPIKPPPYGATTPPSPERNPCFSDSLVGDLALPSPPKTTPPAPNPNNPAITYSGSTDAKKTLLLARI